MLLLIPIALNLYHPQWNEFLKSLPFFGQSSTLIRWFSLYTVGGIVGSVVLLNSFVAEPVLRRGLALLGIVVWALGLMFMDGNYYKDQPYDGSTIREAYRSVAEGSLAPSIHGVGVMVDNEGRMIAPLNRNDLITKGLSQLFCYNPMFGYSLEGFPIGRLHPGSALEKNGGELNLKRPACYVFPDTNGCKPGSAFGVEQEEQAREFLAYRGSHWRLPWWQIVAQALSLIGLGLLMVIYGAFMVYRLVLSRTP